MSVIAILQKLVPEWMELFHKLEHDEDSSIAC